MVDEITAGSPPTDQTVRPSDKNPLYHATPFLGVTWMKYKHSI